jgi:hypothetical protein
MRHEETVTRTLCQKIAAGFKEKLLTAFGATLNEGRDKHCV